MNYDKMEIFSGPIKFDPNDGEHFYRVLSNDFIDNLKKVKTKTLINYEIISQYSDTHFIVKTKRLPYQVKIQEVTKQYALQTIKDLILDNISCLEQSCIISDIHEGNILYWWKDNKPLQTYYIDLDGIFEATLNWCQIAYIRTVYLLYKYAMGMNIPNHDCLIADTIKNYSNDWYTTILDKDFTKKEIWLEILDHVNSIKLEQNTAYAEWFDNYALISEQELATKPKIKPSIEILTEIANKNYTLLDIGCNKGYITSLLSDKYKYLAGIDIEDKCIEHAIKIHSQQNLIFSKVDIRLFSESNVLPAIKRYESDVVVILALTHHLNTLKIDAIQSAKTMVNLARKYIFIEDIADIPSYHNTFKESGFKCVKECESYPSDRKLTLWKRD